MSGKQAPERLAADAAGIARAAELLRAGRLVAVPTETVYGLAARADSEAAVAAIYRAKGRPDFNPLIVHVASLGQARQLARFDERAETLASQYWPEKTQTATRILADINARQEFLSSRKQSFCGTGIPSSCKSSIASERDLVSSTLARAYLDER